MALKDSASRSGIIIWFLVIVVAGSCLLAKSNRVRPEIRQRSLLVSGLERSVVAVRRAARSGQLEAAELHGVLLAHGIKSEPLPVRDGAELRLRIHIGRETEGELVVRKNRDGRRIATVFSLAGGSRLELRSLLTTGDS